MAYADIMAKVNKYHDVLILMFDFKEGKSFSSDKEYMYFWIKMKYC